MKYLKSFNESSEIYDNVEISREEYKELLGGTFDPGLKKVLPFDDSEFKQIKSFCFNLTGNSTIISLDKKLITVFNRNTPRILIEKLNDEWYVCKYIKEVPSGDDWYDKYYKCDTFAGLLQELERYLV